MGPKIIVISGFRNNRGQKSADSVISEPRNTALPSSQNWDDLTFGYYEYLVPRISCHHCLLCTWYNTCLLCTSPITRNKESQTHLLQHTALVVCETELRPRTNATTAAPPPSKPPQKHHTSRDSSRGGGNLKSPATVYVPDFQKYRQPGKQDPRIRNKTTSRNQKP